MKYFENFPLIDYNNHKVQNLMVRIKLLEGTKDSSTIYYPYTIRDGERAENLAFDYYNSTDYVWIIYLVNNIIDPYYDWPLTSNQFDDYIAKKYETSSGVNDGISVAKSTTIGYKKYPSVYYVNQQTNVVMTQADFMAQTPTDPWNWTSISQNDEIMVAPDTVVGVDYFQVSVYSNELEKNENKKFIRLLDKTYTQAISAQLKSLLEQ